MSTGWGSLPPLRAAITRISSRDSVHTVTGPRLLADDVAVKHALLSQHGRSSRAAKRHAAPAFLAEASRSCRSLDIARTGVHPLAAGLYRDFADFLASFRRQAQEGNRIAARWPNRRDVRTHDRRGDHGPKGRFNYATGNHRSPLDALHHAGVLRAYRADVPSPGPCSASPRPTDLRSPDVFKTTPVGRTVHGDYVSASTSTCTTSDRVLLERGIWLRRLWRGSQSGARLTPVPRTPRIRLRAGVRRGDRRLLRARTRGYRAYDRGAGGSGPVQGGGAKRQAIGHRTRPARRGLSHLRSPSSDRHAHLRHRPLRPAAAGRPSVPDAQVRAVARTRARRCAALHAGSAGRDG